MAQREWWPADWADEVMPPGRSSPDDFLIDAEGHYFLGYRLDATDVTEHEKRYFNRGLDCGDIIEFVCCDSLGHIEVTINPDGTYKTSDSVPERATHFWVPGDTDTLADSLSSFAECYAENDDIKEPVTETVALAWWSERLPHKLTISFERNLKTKASFAAVSMAEAKQ